MMLEMTMPRMKANHNQTKLLRFILGKFKTEFLSGFLARRVFAVEIDIFLFNLRKNFFKYPRFKWFLLVYEFDDLGKVVH